MAHPSPIQGPWPGVRRRPGPVAAWPTPVELKRVGKARTGAGLKARGCRRHATWAGQIVSALEPQSVTVAGTDAAAVVLPHLARQLIAPRAQRADVAAQVETPWRVAHPHVPGPDHTCPGSGVPAATVLAGPAPGQRPPGTGGQLASYAGLAPVTRRSGSSIRGEHVFKRAMFLSTFGLMHLVPVSKTLYQRK